MDIEQFFTDINIHNKTPQRNPPPSSPTTQLLQKFHSSSSTKLKDVGRELSGIYHELRTKFDGSTLRLPDQNEKNILSRFMKSSRIIRFPKIYHNDKDLQINARRRRASSNLGEHREQKKLIVKDEVFVMERDEGNTNQVNPNQSTNNLNLGDAINMQLNGRSQTSLKVVLEKRPKETHYATLTKEYHSKYLLRDKELDKSDRRFSIPQNKIYLQQTIDVYGPRLHSIRQGRQHQQTQQLPQITPHQINPRLTRHGYSNDATILQTATFEPLGGRSIQVQVQLSPSPSPSPSFSPTRIFVTRAHSLPKKQLLQKQRSLKKVTIRDLKMEFQPLFHRDFVKLIQTYNWVTIGENKEGMYKAYFGKGNNSTLVKKCLKARGYWTIVETMDEDVNFMWTQIRNNRFYDGLPQRVLKRLEKEEEGEGKKSQLRVSHLLVPFMEEKLPESPFLQLIDSLLVKQLVPKYFNEMIINYFKRPRTAISAKNLPQFLLSERPAKYQPLLIQNPHSIKLHNHVSSSSSIGNKKGLLFFMKKYYNLLNLNPFTTIPQTLHLSSPSSQPITQQQLKKSLPFGLPCILKPGQSTNRGKGITVHTSWPTLVQAINKNTKHENGQTRTHIIQRYIMPFLYFGRKFDIRVWVLWSGRQAWWYREGYIRTSSKEFSIKSTSKFVHLTNDAIQKFSEDYGKYEPGNKISFNEFQKYLDHNHPGKLNFYQTIYPQMKRIARDIFRVGHHTMDPQHKPFGYELFGLDFMIDESFKVWLIQANTNPCLETSCSILTRLISNMIDNVISIAVDPLFPPPSSWKKRSPCWAMETFRFQVIYDGFYENEVLELQEEEVKFEDEEDQFDEKEETCNK